MGLEPSRCHIHRSGLSGVLQPGHRQRSCTEEREEGKEQNRAAGVCNTSHLHCKAVPHQPICKCILCVRIQACSESVVSQWVPGPALGAPGAAGRAGGPAAPRSRTALSRTRCPQCSSACGSQRTRQQKVYQLRRSESPITIRLDLSTLGSGGKQPLPAYIPRTPTHRLVFLMGPN